MSGEANNEQPLVEREGETEMIYDDRSSVPIYVAAAWALVMIGLGAYFLIYYITDLRKWGMP
jgi:hypothetical protein